jgi:hypothetical protein
MSKDNALQKYAVAGISDVLSCFGVPTAVASQIYADVLQKRGAEALEILLSEIRQGHFKNIDQNEAVSIIARFQRDAMEGVARNNLRLMARIINGMATRQALRASTFLQYANILAALTEEEIGVLGIMAKHAANSSPGLHPNTTYGFLEYVDPEAEELKAVFPNYAAIQQSLVRTGLVFFYVDSHTKGDFKLDGGDFSGSNPGSVEMGIHSKIHYRLTPLMGEILKYTDFLIKDKDK